MIKGSIKRTTSQALAHGLDVRRPDDCWPWTGQIMKNGYGRLYGDGKHDYVHKAAYREANGDIPADSDIDHLCHDQSCAATDKKCRHRRCGNPAHLIATTHRANTLRGNSPPARNAAKTRCSHGHTFDEENTYWLNGKRRCRACHRAEVRARYVPVAEPRPRPTGRTKTRCPAGHLYAETLATWPSGRRYCAACRLARLGRAAA